MKRILLASALLFGSIASASAACTGPAVMHDFPGTSFNMSLATASDGNCASNTNPANPANWGIGAFGSAMPANGIGNGVYDGTNLVRARGDETNGVWVNIKSSVSIGVTGTFWQATQPVSIATMPTTPVTGTFWQATQPVSIASMPSTPVTGTFWPYTLGQQVAGSSVPVVLPAAQITTLTPPTSVGISGTLPGFASTPTVNIGTLGGGATAANQATEIASLATIATNSAGANPVNLNTVVTAQTGLTPGATTSAQTGAIVAANVDLSSQAGVALAVPTAYGTAPTGRAISANVFMTSGNITQVNGAPISATNGLFSNILQGNAALTLSNPLPAQDVATSATGSAAPAKAIYTGVIDEVGGNLAGLTGDPCQTGTKTTLPITLATAAVKVIATGVSAKKAYVCQINLNNNAADTVAIFEATTGTTCATSPIAMIGAGTSVATAGTGYNFGATGGISLGTGGNKVLQTTVNNNDICIAQSAATQLSGSITFATR
jgi:hypothetical protein